MESRPCYVPTRFLSYSTSDNGSLMLHNSLTGALGAVPANQAQQVKEALRRSSRVGVPLQGVLQDLADGGFLIPEGTDEESMRRDVYLSKYNRHALQLIILPTEECNFRCTYCYESFERGVMKPELVDSIKKYVENEHRTNGLTQLDVAWFGGEPLLAAGVVVELTQYFYTFCTERNIQYTCGITTNGSLLTPELVESLVPYGMGFFQITLDGLAEDHDVRRVAIDGQPSFDRIIQNLEYMRSTPYTYIVSLRHNFDPDSLTKLESYIAFVRSKFGNDPRFTTTFEAIGTWGGANDDDLAVCDGNSAAQSRMRAKRLAVEAGFHNTFQMENFQPNGYICYASNPRSLVIGSDGTLYKCTVELDYHDRNIVGKLHEGGRMDIDWRKMALWVEDRLRSCPTQTRGEAWPPSHRVLGRQANCGARPSVRRLTRPATQPQN